MIRRLLQILLATLPFGCSDARPLPDSEVIAFAELEALFERLVQVEYAVVVITIQNTNDFVQFTGGLEGVQMDFPLVTEPQQAHEKSIRAFFAARGLEVIDNVGSDGSRFIDADLPPDPSVLAELTGAALMEVFAADSSSMLVVASQGLPSAA